MRDILNNNLLWFKYSCYSSVREKMSLMRFIFNFKTWSEHGDRGRWDILNNNLLWFKYSCYSSVREKMNIKRFIFNFRAWSEHGDCGRWDILNLLWFKYWQLLLFSQREDESNEIYFSLQCLTWSAPSSRWLFSVYLWNTELLKYSAVREMMNLIRFIFYCRTLYVERKLWRWEILDQNLLWFKHWQLF